jgi:hypothetical protein
MPPVLRNASKVPEFLVNLLQTEVRLIKRRFFRYGAIDCGGLHALHDDSSDFEKIESYRNTNANMNEPRLGTIRLSRVRISPDLLP